MHTMLKFKIDSIIHVFWLHVPKRNEWKEEENLKIKQTILNEKV